MVHLTSLQHISYGVWIQVSCFIGFFTNIFTIPRYYFYNKYMEVDFFQVVNIISMFSKPLQKALFSNWVSFQLVFTYAL